VLESGEQRNATTNIIPIAKHVGVSRLTLARWCKVGLANAAIVDPDVPRVYDRSDDPRSFVAGLADAPSQRRPRNGIVALADPVRGP
jgi:hypothetical protein